MKRVITTAAIFATAVLLVVGCTPGSSSDSGIVRLEDVRVLVVHRDQPEGRRRRLHQEAPGHRDQAHRGGQHDRDGAGAHRRAGRWQGARPRADPGRRPAEVHAVPGQLRRPGHARRRQDEGRLPRLGDGTVDRPRTARSSGSRPMSAAWRSPTARTCSRPPACPPTGTRCPSCGRPGTRSSDVGKKYSQATGKPFVDNTSTSVFFQAVNQGTRALLRRRTASWSTTRTRRSRRRSTWR